MSRESLYLVFFDFPSTTKVEKKLAAKFVRSLRRQGYLMIQESVYIKHVRNNTNFENEKNLLDKIAPQDGDLVVLQLTVHQFENISVIRGVKDRFEYIYSPILYF